MARLLVLGPDQAQTKDIRVLLRQDGHQVAMHGAVAGWRGQERTIRPEVVVAVVDSSGEILSEPDAPIRGFPAPLLLIQSETDFQAEVDLDNRLVDRLTSPFMREELLARVDALVRLRRVVLHGSPDGTSPESDGGVKGMGQRLAALLRSRIPRIDKPLDTYLDVASRAAQWADRRDAFEPGHAERVTSLCATMADGLELGETETTILLRAAMLHDIGKIALPVEVLHQKAPLDQDQLRMIRMHPKRGAALMRALDRDGEVADAIQFHHERPDGKGYYGLDGNQIPLPARILAVAEVYDAMTSSRIQDPLTPEEALTRIAAERGRALDAECVDALVGRIRPRRSEMLELSPDPLSIV